MRNNHRWNAGWTAKACGPGTLQTYRRWDPAKGILPYLPADDMPPAPCNYREDSATLRGFWPQAAGQTLECTYNKAFIPQQEMMTADIDSSGYFELHLPLTDLTPLALWTSTGYQKVWLRPQNELFVYVHDGTALAMGADSRLNNERWNTQGYQNLFPDKVSDSECVRKVRQNFRYQQTQLDSTMRRHPCLSSAYRHLAEEEIFYTALWTLFEQQFHRAADQPELSPELLALADSLMREMPDTPAMTSTLHWAFTNNSLYYYYDQKFTVYLRRIRQALSEAPNLQVPDSVMRRLDQVLEQDTAADFHRQSSDLLQELSQYVETELFTIAFLKTLLETADTLPLPDKDNHHPFTQMRDDVTEISRAFDYFHKQGILMQRYKTRMEKTNYNKKNIRYTLIDQASLPPPPHNHRASLWKYKKLRIPANTFQNARISTESATRHTLKNSNPEGQTLKNSRRNCSMRTFLRQNSDFFAARNFRLC